jgi:hypothetical protein
MGMHTEYEIMDAHDAPEERVQQEIDRNANTTVIDIQPEDITPVQEEKPYQDKPVAELEKENNKKGTDSKQADQPEQVTMTGPTF